MRSELEKVQPRLDEQRQTLSKYKNDINLLKQKQDQHDHNIRSEFFHFRCAQINFVLELHQVDHPSRG